MSRVVRVFFLVVRWQVLLSYWELPIMIILSISVTTVHANIMITVIYQFDVKKYIGCLSSLTFSIHSQAPITRIIGKNILLNDVRRYIK